MRIEKYQLAWSLVALLSAGGCQTTGQLRNGVYEDEDVRYAVAAPGGAFVALSLPDADLAWNDASHAAVLLVNSHCQGVADSSLESLTNDLLMGTTEREVVTQERSTNSGRDALSTYARAKIDGVTRAYQLQVTKKDGCVYDVVMSAPEADMPQVTPAFRAVAQSLDVQARPKRPEDR